ncbi:MAG TPA: 30S ribosomal protein S4 [Flavobacteriales bacterium]|jgi:small subunit ribosomal protein S4|nr:30S ribosomal protein S4 [Flavobacteriales bacterium]HAW74078.1 30S ribosomal protein S4 [Flavobacteriales bacterium]|tara:strand:+ start:3346 stop:3951 length:606 start_codon:yes stop_codon:yes gene_type:complete
MARYRGPKSKISRRFKEAIFGPDKALERRPYGPGQHGNSRRRKKESEYSVQLAEKQKAKYTYGILEKQFSNMFKAANARQGITGEILLQFCESRLDNVVYRLGIASTRRGARQLVTHRHVMVNGHVVNIPSYRMRPGDVVAVREKSKSMSVISSALGATANRLDWLDWNVQTMSGTFINVPTRDQIPENIKESLIVELYSK